MDKKNERNEKFRNLLKEKDIHGEQLGRRIGVGRSNVSSWVRGKSRPTLEVIPKIANVLEVSIEDVMACFVEVKSAK